MKAAGGRRPGVRWAGALVLVASLLIAAAAAGVGSHPWWRVGPVVGDNVLLLQLPGPVWPDPLWLDDLDLLGTSAQVNIFVTVNNIAMVEASGAASVQVTQLPDVDVGVSLGY
ncbi:MAG: hypothetical protein HY683_04590 [Chloroflexi bacterium]|nr:hypothetical protein [Chloroflexota bacterium]